MQNKTVVKRRNRKKMQLMCLDFLPFGLFYVSKFQPLFFVFNFRLFFMWLLCYFVFNCIN
jgi:hypothetical protein